MAYMNTTPTITQTVHNISTQFAESDIYFGHGTDNPGDEAFFLVFHVCGLPFDADESVWNQLVTKDQLNRIESIAHTRITQKIPLAYLLNEAWFAGLKFYVDQRVLVPRSPFAEIIQAQFEPWVDLTQVIRVLDLCTGSGCMAIATAYALPTAQIDAVDISPDAIEVAKRNIADHGLSSRIRLIESDVFNALANERYDLIISNPPYVDAADMSDLPAEYRHEPEIGLSSGSDGLDITKRILREAKHHLTPHGALMLEVGNSFPALEAQFPELPFTWIEMETGEDGIFLLYYEDLP
jgi:ribosomal protein L3 glutamine methyltransferase